MLAYISFRKKDGESAFECDRKVNVMLQHFRCRRNKKCMDNEENEHECSLFVNFSIQLDSTYLVREERWCIIVGHGVKESVILKYFRFRGNKEVSKMKTKGHFLIKFGREGDGKYFVRHNRGMNDDFSTS